MNNGYQQCQIYSLKQNQKQEEAQIEYFVYQDLQNLINLLYSKQAVLEHFHNNPNNQMVTLSDNKIILQLNLSGGIHQDLQQQYSNNPYLSSKLQHERNYALQTLKNVAQQFENQFNPFSQNQELVNDPIGLYLKKYINNYESGQFEKNQFELLKTDLESQFNQQVLQKVISSIQTVDTQINQIRQDGNQKPTQEQIIQRAEQYKQMTKIKLISQNNLANQNYKQEIMDKNDYSLENTTRQQQICSNFQQAKKSLQSNINIEQEKLLEFIQYLENHKQTRTQSLFHSEAEKLFVQAKNFLACGNNQSIFENSFEIQLSKFPDLLKLQIILFYYFVLFLEYFYNNRAHQYQELFNMIEEIIHNSKSKEIIDVRFFQYLVNQKDLIKRYLAQNIQINNRQEPHVHQRIQELDYIWSMYNGFCISYQVKRN
ncbi:unnamed protein product [Paramecium octaurelia]|uniref:Uncharacterized protein n=1 Tax=Paramecium octaurelia TaxID=43137 RepID=A0A8S1XZF3_PAROT|nr:unnamed protein product [Paramecium octaurelia]